MPFTKFTKKDAQPVTKGLLSETKKKGKQRTYPTDNEPAALKGLKKAKPKFKGSDNF